MAELSSLKDLKSYRKYLCGKKDKTKKIVRICMTGCRAFGAGEIKEKLEEEVEALKLKNVEIVPTGCQGFCAQAPVMTIDPFDIFYGRVSLSDVKEIVSETLIKGKIIEHLLYKDPFSKKPIPHTRDIPFFKEQLKIVLRRCGKINPTDIDDYIANDGYKGLERIFEENILPEKVIEEIKSSGLRGRGGAGFPTGLKWEFTRKASGNPKYIICNADEGDPGAFMDRAILEGDPHSVIEGMLIAGYAIGAEEGYVYVRAEYPIAVEHLSIALCQAKKLGLIGKNILGTGFSFDIKIKKGAGAFVCGEETALIASIEGKRGMPRPRPPFPAQSGLWGKPTCINNVETLANVSYIIFKGAKEFARVGTEESKGTKIFALAGKVKNTGLVEVPIGTSLRKVVFDIGGGPPEGRKFKAVQIGGPSGGCVPERYLDLPIDYDSLKKVGAIMGSGGMVVMDDNTCMVDVARFFLEFVQDESCGKCVPCRIGTRRMLEILTRITKGEGKPEDIALLEELARTIKDASLCGLGQTAPNPVLSTLTYFRDEYKAHIEDKSCPAGTCEELFISPCQNACPAGIDIPGYIGLIAQGKFLEALELIRKDNPFPAICGRVCHHPCESKCRRGEIDEPVAINALKRFVSDHARGREKPPKISPFVSLKKEKIAVIGSGPAGLTCAHYLAMWGYPVTVFEALPVAGGMLRVGIPDYRLPKDILEEEIFYSVESLGVRIEKGVKIGRDIAFDELFKMGYSCIFIGVGCHVSRRLNIEGEESEGVLDGVEFLKKINLGEKFRLDNKKVVVIGGGNAAVDAARSALRLGAGEVTILYRRSPQEMPAIKSEITAAEKEGVKFHYLAAPLKIVSSNGKIEGLECVCMRLGEYDKSGRRKPVPVDGSEFFIPADCVVSSIGQLPDLSFLPSYINRTGWGGIWINYRTLATSKEGVFAGGDVVTGPATVVEAIALGKKAAISISRYLRGEPLERPTEVKRKYFGIDELAEVEPSQERRVKMPCLPLEERKKGFQEIDLGFGQEEALREARRCLRCDIEKFRGRF